MLPSGQARKTSRGPIYRDAEHSQNIGTHQGGSGQTSSEGSPAVWFRRPLFAKKPERGTHDFDVLYVAAFTPVLSQTLPVKVDLHAYTEYEFVRIARSLRYSPRFLSRAKMYMRDTWHGTLRHDIAACLLLGQAYANYGFLQMENEKRYRDYSVHEVISGRRWWRALQSWTQEYRGPTGLFVDKSLGRDHFKPNIT